MQTEAVFENIALRIQEEIGKAQKSIYIAVAWFTNRNIFDQLLLKANDGCTVHLIVSDDEINNNSSIDFERLKNCGGKVYKIGNGNTDLMHHKFCVIDYKTVITGSYNWSYKAETNSENITINSEDPILAEQFVKEFINVKNKQFPGTIKKGNDYPLEKIIKRLEILKNYILLEDLEDIQNTAQKLQEYDSNEDINAIIIALQQKEFSRAIVKIQKFITNYQQLSVWNDPEISALKLELRILESQINAFDNEKVELEKVLSDFQYRHTIELGEIILEVLKYRKAIFKDNDKRAKETEEDYDNYNEQFETEKNKQQFDLTEDEKTELKKNYRKATMLCHPDKVSEEQKSEAEKVFIELKEAQERNDIQTVNRILKELENGNIFSLQTEKIEEKTVLKARVEKLRYKLQQLEKQITELKNSESFIEINAISNWDNYFAETKEQLQNELESLKLQLEPLV
jgi:hypothetical protein